MTSAYNYNGIRARRQMTDDQIREMGEMFTTGKHTQAALGRAFGVSMTVVRRSLDYYDSHLKHADTTKEH